MQHLDHLTSEIHHYLLKNVSKYSCVGNLFNIDSQDLQEDTANICKLQEQLQEI
jgi:hypothetical protein